jgi:hypothetical protein
MLWPFIEIGSWIFWVLVGGLCIWELICVEFEKRVGAWFGLVGFVLAIWLLGNFELIHFLRANGAILAVYAASYFLAGMLWAWIKWEFLSAKNRSAYNEFQRKWLDSLHLPDKDVPQEYQEAWTLVVIEEYAGGRPSYQESKSDFLKKYSPQRIKGLVIPRVRDNKARIMFWLAHWPFSLFWTFFRNVLADVWNFIYIKIGSFLDMRAKSHFRGIESQFADSSKASETASKTV